jgi:bifunctional non-homologous end joining protein LigD
VEDGRARLASRNGKDWTRRFPAVAAAAAALPVASAVLDGEVAWVRPDGTTSFQALQRAGRAAAEGELRYFVFDLLHLEGRDVTAVPLIERKEALRRHVRGRGPAFLAEVCRRGLEGSVSKHADAPYRGRRTRDWVKVRCGARQEMVLGGYVPHARDRSGVGALLMGTYDAEGRLRYAGRVGTGFTTASRRDLKRTLDAHARPASSFEGPVDARGEVRFVAPVLVAEVAFTEWTSDGRLRHPSFLGLREDKRAREVVREAPAPTNDGKARPPRARAARPVAGARGDPAPGRAAGREDVVLGVRLTNPDKVLWPAAGITKRDLALYYEAVAERMLPLVEGRPLMLLRCPDGSRRDCFHQKHLEGPAPKGLRTVPIAEHGARRAYATVASPQGLVALAQMGALELHVWGSRADRLERPDRVVFDLDPAPDVPFASVVSAARDLRDRLEALGLASFPATTGGKGLHVHVPIERVHAWEDVRRFARLVADRLVEAEPRRYVATASKARRAGRIYVDWLRNVRGATAVAPYSPRARDGATVATPLSWDEVTARLRPDRWTIATVPRRVAGRAADPWRRYGDVPGRLAPALERLETQGRS